MLELLYGPVALSDGQTAGPVADFSNGTAAFYDDGLGVCGFFGSGYGVAQLDGVSYLRSTFAGPKTFVLDLQRYGEHLVTIGSFDDNVYTFDKRSGARGTLLATVAVGTMVGVAVRAADRYLDIISAAVRWRDLDLTIATNNPETTLTHAGSGRPTVSLVGGNVIALVYADGPVVFYDVLARAQVGKWGDIGANNGAWYSGKHDVFVAITDHGTAASTLSVFASDVRPASLSNPVAVDAITQGRASQIKVRLLGSNAEPCADELVDWSITAGAGALAVPQSTTDADGWAYNDYIAPVSSTGSVTIAAAVLF